MARILQIQARRGTAATWTSANPVLAAGEPGYETDTNRVKLGDGTTAWTSLPYLNAQRDTPALMPGTALHRWDPKLYAYNVGTNMRTARSAMKKLRAGTRDMNILFLTDSTGTSYDGTGYNWDKGVVRTCGKVLARLMDVNFMGGFQSVSFAQSGTLNQTTDNLQISGTWNFYYNMAFCNGTGFWKWTSRDNCTEIEFLYDKRSTNNFTYQVDGGATVAVPTDGSVGIGKVSITGLTDTTHTLQINGGTSQVNYIYYVRGKRSGEKALHVHGLVHGGSKANTAGTNGLNWSDTTSVSPVGLGWSAPTAWTAGGVGVPDLIVAMMCNNDTSQGTAAATALTGLWTALSYSPWAGAPAIVVHPPKVSTTTDVLEDALAAGFFGFADLHNVGYVSWDEYSGRRAGYSADGLAGADGEHPIVAEQIAVGQLLANVIASTMGFAPTPRYGAGAIIESGGVYGLRPNIALAPAGAVPWQGADQPAGWIDGDAWDDLP